MFCIIIEKDTTSALTVTFDYIYVLKLIKIGYFGTVSKNYSTFSFEGDF